MMGFQGKYEMHNFVDNCRRCGEDRWCVVRINRIRDQQVRKTALCEDCAPLEFEDAGEPTPWCIGDGARRISDTACRRFGLTHCFLSDEPGAIEITARIRPFSKRLEREVYDLVSLSTLCACVTVLPLEEAGDS